jgi:hypothetical protein
MLSAAPHVPELEFLLRANSPPELPPRRMGNESFLVNFSHCEGWGRGAIFFLDRFEELGILRARGKLGH